MIVVKPLASKGFTFLGLLATMVIVAIGMASVGVVWSKAAKREREKELLFIGQAYQRAIGSYYENKAGTAKKQYPKKLEDLIEDKRSGTSIVRHLRKLYKDPMTDSNQWGLIKQQGGIVGVFSTSTDKPINQFAFDDANTYQDWVFRFSSVKTEDKSKSGSFNNTNNNGANPSNPISFPDGSPTPTNRDPSSPSNPISLPGNPISLPGNPISLPDGSPAPIDPIPNNGNPSVSRRCDDPYLEEKYRVSCQ